MIVGFPLDREMVELQCETRGSWYLVDRRIINFWENWVEMVI